MIVGMLLIDQDDIYVREDGSLPKRPAFDKGLLLGVATNQVGICSDNTKKDFPPSLLKVMKDITNSDKGDLAMSPDKIDKNAHLLIISRSSDSGLGGKKFRFDKFKRLVSMYSLEIWVRDYEKEIK